MASLLDFFLVLCRLRADYICHAFCFLLRPLGPLLCSPIGSPSEIGQEVLTPVAFTQSPIPARVIVPHRKHPGISTLVALLDVVDKLLRIAVASC